MKIFITWHVGEVISIRIESPAIYRKLSNRIREHICEMITNTRK
jgi:hypothetical protein